MAAVILVNGAIFGSWGPRVPAIKHQAGLDDGELGLALMGFAIGLFVGTRLAGTVVDRFGSRPAIRTTALLLCPALVGPALAHSLVALAAALVVFGVLGGFIDVAMNAQAVAVERGYGRPIMAGLHGLWSAGLLAGALGGTAAAAAGAAPALHFGIVAGVLAVPSLLTVGGLLTASAEALPTTTHERGRRLLLAPVVLLLGLMAFSSYSGEGSALDWSAVYLRDTLHTSPALAATAFVAFSVAMAACRFVSDRLSVRFGPVTVVRAGSLVAACGLGLGLIVNRPAAGVAAFALVGAGLAPVVPIVFSAAGNTGLGTTGVILGRVVTMGYLGGIIGPIVIGQLAQAVGLRAALGFTVALALLIAAMAGTVRPAVGGPRVSTAGWPAEEPVTDADHRGLS